MKIFCHIPREDWFCDRYGKEYTQFSSHIVTHNDLENADVIWLLAAWCWNQIPAKYLNEKPVVCTIHHEVPWKFNEQRLHNFKSRDFFVDIYHVPCKQTKDFISKFTDKPIEVIGYWCNNHLWKESGEEKTILFNLCGYGHFDMQAYIDYFNDKLFDQEYSDEEIGMALSGLPSV